MTGRPINYSGFVVALVGFGLTRFTVTLAIFDDPIPFYLAGVGPLALGLGLAAVGVALMVADVDPRLVRTTAVWCLVGVGVMLVLTVLTLAGTAGTITPELRTVRSQAFLSNFLIGGGVGGALIGLYAGRNRCQREELAQQANRLLTLNRVLRHEVLNAVAVIRGHTSTGDATDRDSMAVIDDQAAAIERTIDQVRYLTRRTSTGTSGRTAVELGPCLRESIATVTDRYPEVDVGLESIPADLEVRASERLSQVFVQLLENAIVHGDTRRPAIDVSADSGTVAISVSDEGPGLPPRQQALLTEGDVEEFDDPSTGFGLNIVRLLLESSGGTITIDLDEDGTTITVTLPRAGAAVPGRGPTPTDLAGVRPALPHLVVAFGAALLAGVAYGIVSESLGGSIAAIGVFYGLPNPLVGWLTHEFHSVVFGFIYVGLLSVTMERFRTELRTYLGVALAWALALWLGAAGLIAPLWLRLLGIEAPIPNISGTLLAAHLAWGLTLGLLTALGYGSVVPWVADRIDRDWIRP